MAIDPRHLKTFLTVCRANSISEAARRMNISQPSVSVAVTQLEQALGARLFERGRSGIALTAEGVAVRRRAEALESLLHSAEAEVRLIERGVSGPMVIGGTPGALASLLPKAVEHLTENHPSFDLTVLERPDPTLNELLRSEQIDFALVTTGIDAVPPDLAEEHLLRDPFSLIAGRQNDDLPSKVALSDLLSHRWVLPEAAGSFHRQVDAVFVATGTPQPARIIRCDSLLATKAIVSRTDCLTILPGQVVAAELAMGVLRAIEIEGAPFIRTIGVRRLAERTLQPIAEAFLTALRQAHREVVEFP